jgi:hypothetical protein
LEILLEEQAIEMRGKIEITRREAREEARREWEEELRLELKRSELGWRECVKILRANAADTSRMLRRRL